MTTETTTTTTLRERASSAYERELAQEAADEASQRLEDGLRLKALLKNVLDLDATPNGPTVEIEGITFGFCLSRWDYENAELQVLRPCDGCQEFDRVAIKDWASLGKALANARTNSSHLCMATLGSAATSTAERLLDVLGDFVREQADTTI